MTITQASRYLRSIGVDVDRYGNQWEITYHETDGISIHTVTGTGLIYHARNARRRLAAIWRNRG